MTTYNVSSASQLKSIVNSAKAGDIVRLAAGNYGALDLTNKKFGGLTITSASSSNKAKFTSVTGTKVANLTLDNLKFEGGGWGVRITNSSNMKVTNSIFNDLDNGLKFQGTSGVVVSNNSFTKMNIDAMQFAGLTNATIQNNKYVESGSRSGWTHKDFIQFFTVNAYGAQASKNVKIIGNQFYSKDGVTHGIYINNEANNGMHQNITIQNNYIKASHVLGIGVAGTNGLVIQNNTLIKDGPHFPLINVTPNSLNVKIINNTAPSVPDLGNKSWVVYGNNETTTSKVTHWTGGITTGIKVPNTGSAGATAQLAETAVAAAETSSGTATQVPAAKSGGDIHLTAKSLAKGTNVSRLDLDFDDRDALVFHDYKGGTFKQVAGGNPLQVSGDGTWARVDSIADLKELDTASTVVSISASKATDVVTVSITTGDAVHKIALEGLAHDYLV